MFGEKSGMRKKAMAEMMKEGPSISVMIEKKKSMDMGEGEDGEKEGFIQMMVSPEEKEMILSMRKEKEGEGAEPEMMEESEEY